jgi:ribosomal protein S27AE
MYAPFLSEGFESGAYRDKSVWNGNYFYSRWFEGLVLAIGAVIEKALEEKGGTEAVMAKGISEEDKKRLMDDMAKSLSWVCPRCGRRIFIVSSEEEERGWCSTCEVGSWSDEKRKSLQDVIRAYRRGESRETLEEKVTEALKYFQEKKPGAR